MTILVTEKRRRTMTSQLNSTGRAITTATRVFEVSGVTTEDEALNQCGVSLGDGHPQASAAVCNYRNAAMKSISFWEVECQYTSDSNESLDLTIQPPIITYEPYIYQIPSYIDANGKHYTNSAGSPFDQPMELDIVGVVLTVTKWETSYPLNKMITYGGKTNLGTFSWPGGYVNEGQAKCLGVFQGETSSSTGLVKVSYRFDLRELGHKQNVPDMGAKGYCNPTGSKVESGVFVSGDVATASTTVRLNGQGIPLNTSFKVKPQGQSPTFFAVSAPTCDAQSLVNSTLSRTGTSGLTVLSFAKSKAIAFDLGL